MLNRMVIRRFKRFEEVEIELANPIVFVGPNNSGKTSALQALALWALGIHKWQERRGQGQATKRTGVTINRRDLVNIPLLNSYALWKELRVRKGNTPIRIEIIIEGIEDTAEEKLWKCGLEFESVDPENIRCRPLERRTLPEGALGVTVAFLPPMSGLVSQEDMLQRGSIERRIGEGRTADVLRNLCYQVYDESPANWKKIQQNIQDLFGVELLNPSYNPEIGTLSLGYQEGSKVIFDLTASGQGFRQTLLLLAYLYANPRSVLLLDEPDAHLEILRQRQIYQVFTNVSQQQGNQLIIATHSEVILDEAAQLNRVVAFVGKPHLIQKTDQIRKALAEYGFAHYTQAEQVGWVLYVEGSTDLAILQALASHLKHPAVAALQRPFVHYVTNLPGDVYKHFYAMREAFPQLTAIAIFDSLDNKQLERKAGITQVMWQKRELENYIGLPSALLAYARSFDLPDDLFGMAEGNKRQALMQELIEGSIPPFAYNDPTNRWWSATKMSDDFLTPLFDEYFARLGLPNMMRKSGFYQLASYIPPHLIDAEINQKLDLIQQVASHAQQLFEQDA